MDHKHLHVKVEQRIFRFPRRDRRVFGIIAFLLSFSSLATADRLEIASGERFDGSLVNIRTGTLSFRTSLAGRIFVPVDEVRFIQTAAFVAVTVDEEQLLPGRIDTLNGEFFIMNVGGEDKTPLPLNRISRIDRIPESERPKDEAAPTAPGSSPRISLETGYRGRLGTEDSSGPYARVGVEGETSRIGFRVLGDFEYTADESAADRYYDLRAGAGLLRDGFSPEVQMELKRDTNRALENRTDIVAGARKTLLEDEKQTLSGFAGLGVAFERWDPKKLRSDQNITTPLPGDASRNEDELNLNLQLRYSRQLLKDATLTQQLSVLPSLSDDEIRASLESRVMVPLSLQFSLQLGLFLDYDNSSPFQRIDELSTAMEAGLRIEF